MNALLQTLPDLASFVFYASVKATLLVVLVLLIQRVAGHYLSAGARYLLWFIVVLSLVTPVGFDNSVHTRLLPDTNVTVFATAVTPVQERTAQPGPAPQDLTPRASAQSPFSSPATSVYREPERMTDTLPAFSLAWLPYLWLAGVSLVLGAIAVSSYRFARLVRRATVAPASLQFFLQDCMRLTQCNTAVTVLLSTDVQVPMIAGFFNPVLLLPQGIDQQLTRAQLRHVFLHELMHLQRGDIVCNWIVALVQALHWFNPAVWFAFFRMRQDRELACDAATLNHLVPSDRLAYGRTLLQLNDTLPHKQVPVVALGILESQSCLQERILMLVHNSRANRARSLVAGLLSLPLAAIAFSQPAAEPVAVSIASTVTVTTAAIAEPAAVVPVVPEPATAAAEPAPPVNAVEQAAPAAVPAPAVAAAPVTDVSDVVDTQLLAQAAAVRVPDPFMVDADTGDAVAEERVELAAATTTLLPEPYTGLADIRQLGRQIAAVQNTRLSFIQTWDDIAADCAARREQFLGSASKPCRQRTKALARGEIFFFGYECFVLNAQQRALRAAYDEAAALQATGLAGGEEALLENEQSLDTFCDKDTYSSEYPAFGALMAEAESLEKFPRANRTYIAGGYIPRTIGMDSVYMTGWIPIGPGGDMGGAVNGIGGPGNLGLTGNPFGAGSMGTPQAPGTGEMGGGAIADAAPAQ